MSLAFEYLHRKSRCECCAQHVFSMYVYIRAHFLSALIGGNLTAQSTGSHRGIGGGIQIPETQLQALIPFPAPPPEPFDSPAFLFRLQQPPPPDSDSIVSVYTPSYVQGLYKQQFTVSVSSKTLRDFWLAAEEVLAQLTDQLNRKKAQLQDAGDKLSQVQLAIADQV